MKTIPLTQGFTAVVDDADFSQVSKFTWYAVKSKRGVYAARTIRLNDRRKTLSLHKSLFPGIPQIDHKDGDGLNNRRENLRPATHRQNQQGSRHKRIGATSQFRGVSWHMRREKWQARIRVCGSLLYLGIFPSEADAARAYDAAARQHFGEFASPNFPAVAGENQNQNKRG